MIDYAGNKMDPVKFYRMRQNVRQTASLVCGGRVREVLGSHWRCDMDTRTIYWHPFAPDLSGRTLTENELIYLIAHEASHISYSGGHEWFDIAEDNEREQKLFHGMVNAGEDLRVDNLTLHEFPGFGAPRRETCVPLLKWHKSRIKSYHPVDQAGLYWFFKHFGLKPPKVSKEMRAWCESKWAEWTKVFGAASTQAVAEIAWPLYLELRDKFKDDGQAKDPDGLMDDLSGQADGEGEGEGQSQAGDGDDEGEGAEVGIDLFGKQPEIGHAEPESKPGWGVGMGEGYLPPETPVRSPHDPRHDNRPGSINNVYGSASAHDVYERLAFGSNHANVRDALIARSRNEGHEAPAINGILADLGHESRTSATSGSWAGHEAEWDSRAARLRPEINLLTRRLQTILRHNAMEDYQGGKRRGRFDSGKAYRGEAGDTHLFRKRHEIGTYDYTIGFSVDRSSSMATHAGRDALGRTRELEDVVVVAAEGLERANVKNFVIPWSNRPAGIKHLEDPLAAVRGFLACNTRPAGGTYEAPSLCLAANEFNKSTSPVKVLITVTDGQTSHPHESVKMLALLAKMGIPCIGIGIDGYAPSHYPHRLVLADCGELATELPKLLRQLIRRG